MKQCTMGKVQFLFFWQFLASMALGYTFMEFVIFMF